MSAPETRKYDASRRRRDAERNRERMVKTAHGLFLHRGYASATLKEVAERAGLAEQTVYAVFGSKRALLFAVFDAARSAAPPSDREPLENVRPLTARTIAKRVRETREGGAPVARIIDRAAAADPEIATLWKEIQENRHERMLALAETLIQTGLADGEAPELADELWGLTSNELYGLLVLDRGWNPTRYEDWLAKTLDRTIFREAGGSADA